MGVTTKPISLRIFSGPAQVWGNPCTFGLSIVVYALIGMPVLTEFFVDNFARTPPFGLEDGDFVHCIPIQTLVRRLPTPTTRWRMAPTMQPRDSYVSDISTFQSIKRATQLLVTEKQICPLGAVPTRSRSRIVHFTRILRSTMSPAQGSNLQGPDGSAKEPPPSVAAEEALWPNDRDNHKYAVADMVGPFRGTQGRLNIWDPHVQDREFSLAQVWVSSLDDNGKLHSLEAGWQVYRDLYGDFKPRLFIFWTNDDYSKTGCYNLLCGGFVQVSNRWLLGGSFERVSTPDSPFQYEIKINIFKDRGTGDWWLQLNDDNVGYWPKSLFGPGAFNDSSTRIDWGGEIWHRRGRYTDTQMGNGNHPLSSGFRRVAYVRNMQVVNYNDILQDPPHRPTPLSTHRGCCHLVVHDEAGSNSSYRSTWGTYAYFGGPGFNAGCVQKKSTMPK